MGRRRAPFQEPEFWVVDAATRFLINMAGYHDELLDDDDGLKRLAIWLATQHQSFPSRQTTYRHFAIAYAAWAIDRSYNRLLLRLTMQARRELEVHRLKKNDTRLRTPNYYNNLLMTCLPTLSPDPSKGPEPYLKLIMDYQEQPVLGGDRDKKRKLSRDARAIAYLVENDIMPPDIEELAQKKGEGIDAWSRKAARRRRSAPSDASLKPPRLIVEVKLSLEGSDVTERWALESIGLARDIRRRLVNWMGKASPQVSHTDGGLQAELNILVSASKRRRMVPLTSRAAAAKA